MVRAVVARGIGEYVMSDLQVLLERKPGVRQVLRDRAVYTEEEAADLLRYLGQLPAQIS